MSELSRIMHIVALCPRCGRTQSVIKVSEPADIITAGKNVENCFSAGIKVLMVYSEDQIPGFCKKYESGTRLAPDAFDSELLDDCSPIDY